LFYRADFAREFFGALPGTQTLAEMLPGEALVSARQTELSVSLLT
tara:strand:- start:249 stop:383 length:135 start_codon:yes stop_codon:yes gene_type:complete